MGVERDVEPRAVVLVEGVSDQHALLALARRRGRDLADEAIRVVPMGGATNIARFLEQYGPQGADVRLAGFCDAGEEWHFRRALGRCGLGDDLGRPEMEERGFFVCHLDLEDELIRCLGTDATEGVLESAGELTLFRTFQRQPAQRERTRERQLRRFLGTQSGRKLTYARLLVEQLDLTRVPRALDGVLGYL